MGACRRHAYNNCIGDCIHIKWSFKVGDGMKSFSVRMYVSICPETTYKNLILKIIIIMD